MNRKTRLILCAAVVIAAGAVSVLVCPLEQPAGKICLAASLAAAFLATAGAWAVSARSKSRLMRTGAQAVGAAYGLLALAGGWGVARLVPRSVGVLGMFHLLCLAGAGVCLFVLASTAQGIRRGRELEQQFPSQWSPLFQRAGACLGQAGQEERPALERLCAALRKCEDEGKTETEGEWDDLLEQLEAAMKKPAGPERAGRVKNLCEEACWLAGLTETDPAGE